MLVTSTKEPTRDLVLEQQLAALGTGTTTEEDIRRVVIYRDSRIRAGAEGRLMPFIPDDVFDAVTRLLRTSLSRDQIDPIVMAGYEGRVTTEANDMGGGRLAAFSSVLNRGHW